MKIIYNTFWNLSTKKSSYLPDILKLSLGFFQVKAHILSDMCIQNAPD